MTVVAQLCPGVARRNSGGFAERYNGGVIVRKFAVTVPRNCSPSSQPSCVNPAACPHPSQFTFHNSQDPKPSPKQSTRTHPPPSPKPTANDFDQEVSEGILACSIAFPPGSRVHLFPQGVRHKPKNMMDEMKVTMDEESREKGDLCAHPLSSWLHTSSIRGTTRFTDRSKRGRESSGRVMTHERGGFHRRPRNACLL